MAAHCLPVEVNILSKLQGGTGSSSHGAHALKGPQNHDTMPIKHRGFATEPKQDYHPTSIHPITETTSQPSTLATACHEGQKLQASKAEEREPGGLTVFRRSQVSGKR